MPTKPQTVFQVKIKIDAVDLRAKPFARDRRHWTDASDYSRCQDFGRTARAAGVGAIRYESVRDPKHDACCAVLSPAAFASANPLEQQTWMLSVARDRVIWQRTHVLDVEEHEFAAVAMVALRALGRTEYEPTWRAMQAFTAARASGTPDEIWLTEHPPVYTLGLAGRREHLLRDNGIPTVKVDRGGQITYHGPGQLVVYLLCDLRREKARRSRDGPVDRGRGGRMA
mgnify:CR=1 FL=1